MFSRTVVAICFAMGINLAFAQTVQLISENEAKLPPSGPELAPRAITRAPGIKLASPEAVSKDGFPFKILFEPRGSAKIDPASVRVVYLRKPEIELTERIRSAIRPAGIDVPSASAPAGEHALRIQVRDEEGRLGTATITLQVK